MTRTVVPLLTQEGTPSHILKNLHAQNREAAAKILEVLGSNEMQILLRLGMRACDEIIADIAGNEGADAAVLHHVRVQQIGIKTYLKGLMVNGDEYAKGTHPIEKAAEPVETETPIA
jgi:hypothetical protein